MKINYKKINNFSAIIWALSSIIFILIILFTTKLFTYDPNFSGVKETPFLLPMLLSVFIGVLSFSFLLIAGIIIKLKKDETEYTPLFGLTTRKSLFIGFFSFFVFFIFLLGVRSGNLGYKKQNYTGQQLFDAVNQYRKQNGIPIVNLDMWICDNIVERYIKIKNGEGHEGFEEWVQKEEIDKKFSLTGELYVKNTYSVEDAISF